MAAPATTTTTTTTAPAPAPAHVPEAAERANATTAASTTAAAAAAGTVVLYEVPLSPYAEKVRRILQYKGVAFESQMVSLLALKKVSPTGKIPAVRLADGRVLTDSTSIAHHFEPVGRPLQPADAVQAALCHVLEDWADESLCFYQMRWRFSGANADLLVPQLLVNQGWLVRNSAGPLIKRAIHGKLDAQGLAAKSDADYAADMHRHMQAIIALLQAAGGRRFLLGDDLLLADIAVWTMLERLNSVPNGVEYLRRYPLIVEWMARVDAATAAAPPLAGSSAAAAEPPPAASAAAARQEEGEVAVPTATTATSPTETTTTTTTTTTTEAEVPPPRPPAVLDAPHAATTGMAAAQPPHSDS